MQIRLQILRHLNTHVVSQKKALNSDENDDDDNVNIKDGVEIVVPLKYLSNFWRTLDILLINCEINLILSSSENCVLTDMITQAARGNNPE